MKKLTRIDDLGGAGVATITRFSLEGSHYEIDLNAENRERFENMMALWIASSRKMGRGGAQNYVYPFTKEARAYALEHGMDINPRGRVPRSVIAAYEEFIGLTK